MKNEKIIYMIISGITAILCGMCLLLSDKSNDGIQGLLFGIGSGLLGAGIAYTISKNVYRKNPELYKKNTIEKNDERNVYIKNKAQAKSGIILMYLNFILAMVMGFYKIALWATLSLILINLIYSFCVVFFINKFNKQG